MAMTFRARSILEVNGVTLTEHNRSPLNVDFELIESSKRTVSGRLRSYVVAKKHNLSVSWENLPSLTSKTVDGYGGGEAIRALFTDNNEVNVKVWTDAEAAKAVSTATLDFQGRVKSVNYNIVKRNIEGQFYDFWNIDLSIEEL